MAETKKQSTTATGSKRATTSKEEKERIKEKELAKAEKLRRERRLHDEIWAIVIIAIGVFLAISLQTETTGEIGNFVQNLLFGCFGRVAYGLSYYLILYGILVFAGKASYLTVRSVVCIIILFLFVSAINAATYDALKTSIDLAGVKTAYSAGVESGGVVGMLMGTFLLKFAGRTGLYIASGAAIIICLLFIVDTPLSTFLDNWKIKRTATRQTRAEQQAENERLLARETALERATKSKEAARAAAGGVPENAKSTTFVPEEKPLPDLPDPTAPPTEAAAAAAGVSKSGGMKIVDGKLQMAGFDGDDTAEASNRFTPETIGLTSHVAPEKIEERQKNILKYMTDENLFGSSAKKDGAQSFGLDGTQNPITGRAVKTSDDSALDSAKADAPQGDVDPNAPPAYKFPSIELLSKPSAQRGGQAMNLKAQAALLEETLHSFGVSATVHDVVKGPAVTRYEVQPAAGVKVASIVRLQDDIALNLKAKSLRIEAPIPGKAAVGIEVANDKSSMVTIREILESKDFQSAKSKISMGLGKNISGASIVADLKEMPHLLIAGTTGSGKSVCINSVIMSILYKAKPEEVKLILIDPKVVELSNYNGIPHLLIPVVTEPAKASAALGWSVSEMNDRYNKFAEEGVRDLESYNETVHANGEDDKHLPQIVIIIDELADLMMAAQNQVEDSICRLAQKARAAGMHLIVATQRPSVDVITGVIKANIPSRIAFAVSSQFDSRTILDMAGAEKLLGKGDMLFSPQGISKPIRVQGCFVSDQEVHSVIEAVKSNVTEHVYAGEVISAIEKSGVGQSRPDDDSDELLTDAIETVVRAEQASVSMLQRRFRIGYNRAARLIDMMEERGIIGAADGSRPRKVNMTLEQFEELEERAKDTE